MDNEKSTFPSLLDVMLSNALFSDIDGVDMKKVNVTSMYQFGFWMAHVRQIKAQEVTLQNYTDILMPLHNAKIFLEHLCNRTDLLPQSEITIEPAKRLLKALSTIEAKLLTRGGKITQIDVGEVNRYYEQFEIILATEFPTLPIFFVSQKRNYSTKSLIESADKEFPPEVLSRIPDICREDTKTSGRCVAFELGTAAGFHAYRALEAVAKDYVVLLGKMPELEKECKNRKPCFGDFLAKIEANSGDAKVVAQCKDIKNTRRNPLAHPEESLTPGEGVQAFKIATTAIELLVQDMEQRGLYPTPLPPAVQT